MHAVIRSGEYKLDTPAIYADASRGYTQVGLVGPRHGSVHTGLTLNELSVDGTIATHVHSFEEGFYVLDGEASVTIDHRSLRCGPGDFGLVKVGTPHSWKNVGSAPVRWLQIAAPQPKLAGSERDTFFPKDRPAGTPSAPSSSVGPDTPVVGHFGVADIPPEDARAAGLAKGVFLKWMIDEQFGAVHHRLLFIEYQPGARIALHDHTFEEAYFILSGEVTATLDGQTYRVSAGDAVWTGVGCVHAFATLGNEPVRWLETFSPQPPRENVFRFMAEWERRAAELEG